MGLHTSKTADKTFGWLLVVGSVLHAGGSIAAYGHQPTALVWLGSFGCLGYIADVTGFGLTIGSVGFPCAHSFCERSGPSSDERSNSHPRQESEPKDSDTVPAHKIEPIPDAARSHE